MSKILAFLRKYRHAWILSYGLVYITWFSYLEKQITPATGYHIMHTAMDDAIPFCEYFIIPYFLWFLYIATGIFFFLFKNKEDFYRVCGFLFSGMTLSLVICSFYPNGTDFRPLIDPDKNIFTRMVAWLYSVDTCTNVFPSIHAYNSIAMHIAIWKSKDLEQMKYGRQLKYASLILAILICMATLCLKQHSILDVCGAIILASIVYGFVYGYPVFEREPDRETERVRVR